MDELKLVKEFDKAYIEVDDWHMVGAKFAYIMLIVLSTPIWIIPVQSEGFIKIPFMCVLLQDMGVHTYLNAYLYCKEGKDRISIFKKLVCVPVSSEVIAKARIQFLQKKCIRIGSAMFLFQQIGTCIEKNWSILNLIAPILGISVIYVSERYMIHIAKRAGRLL